MQLKNGHRSTTCWSPAFQIMFHCLEHRCSYAFEPNWVIAYIVKHIDFFTRLDNRAGICCELPEFCCLLYCRIRSSFDMRIQHRRGRGGMVYAANPGWYSHAIWNDLVVKRKSIRLDTNAGGLSGAQLLIYFVPYRSSQTWSWIHRYCAQTFPFLRKDCAERSPTGIRCLLRYLLKTGKQAVGFARKYAHKPCPQRAISLRIYTTLIEHFESSLLIFIMRQYCSQVNSEVHSWHHQTSLEKKSAWTCELDHLLTSLSDLFGVDGSSIWCTRMTNRTSLINGFHIFGDIIPASVKSAHSS